MQALASVDDRTKRTTDAWTGIKNAVFSDAIIVSSFPRLPAITLFADPVSSFAFAAVTLTSSRAAFVTSRSMR